MTEMIELSKLRSVESKSIAKFLNFSKYNFSKIYTICIIKNISISFDFLTLSFP